MNISKVFLASMLAVSAASSAFASTGTYDVVLRITGSTAFRASTATAISNIITSNKRIGFIGSSHTGASAAVYTGTLANGKTIMVQTNWTGSEAGFQSVAAKSPVNRTWIGDENLNTQSVGYNAALAGYTYAGATNVVSGPAVDTALANVAMADNAQSESLQIGAAYNTLTNVRVGVIPFAWVRNNSADSGIQTRLNRLTNVTGAQIQSILNGRLALSGITADSADESLFVYTLGRDSMSGTRLNCLLEAFGASRSALSADIIQINATVTGGNITAADAYPQSAQGLTSGGTLVQTLAKPATADVGVALIGYAGVSDISAGNYPNVVAPATDADTYGWTGSGTNPVLSYNGVPYTRANVKNGSYTFWGYEYLAYGTAISGNTDAQAAVITLSNNIRTTTANVSGIFLTDMKADRLGAGKAPTTIVQ